jgi:hypothetical protein
MARYKTFGETQPVITPQHPAYAYQAVYSGGNEPVARYAEQSPQMMMGQQMVNQQMVNQSMPMQSQIQYEMQRRHESSPMQYGSTQVQVPQPAFPSPMEWLGDCKLILRHINKCAVCAKLYPRDHNTYVTIIVILILFIMFLLTKLLDK